MALTLKTGKLSEGMSYGLTLADAEAARPVGKRSAAGRGASESKVPVGNHGDNLQPTTAPRFVVQIDTLFGVRPWEDNSDPQGLATALQEAFETRLAGWRVRVLPA